jgi:ABC-2 type transport system permease protein
VRGLWNLTWLEVKIFVREPLGFFGTVIMPVLMFLLLGKFLGDRAGASARLQGIMGIDLPIFIVMLTAINAVANLINIIAIYREGGILKRLRATPLRPATILTAHVLVKLIFTTFTLALLAIGGRRLYPVELDVPWTSFGLAVLVTIVAISSIGFLIASVVPTARFAQPLGSMILFPMLGVSGLFVSVSALPPVLQVIAHALPLTYAVSLLRGIWQGDSWLAHGWDVLGLAVVFAIFTALSARWFRWE